MILRFLEEIPGERELMATLGERLDCLWQQIQDWLIAAVQNWRILLREREGETRVPSAGVPVVAIATNLVVIHDRARDVARLRASVQSFHLKVHGPNRGSTR